jgi:hypothetical protein
MRLLFPTLLLPAVALAGTGFDDTWKTNMESLKTTQNLSFCCSPEANTPVRAAIHRTR